MRKRSAARRGGRPRPKTRRVAAIGADGRATFTVQEVAGLLGVGRDAVYEAVNRREIPGVIRIGRRIVFARATLLEWLGNPAPSEE